MSGAGVALVTGAGGLVGSEAVRFLAAQGMDVVGVDNDMRRELFGDDASTAPVARALEAEVRGYRHHRCDIRDRGAMQALFAVHGAAIGLVVHAAAQPSHDLAARDPRGDFAINAVATLDLLELAREHCPDCVFAFLSTNKVYGDSPNRLPLVEHETRFEISPEHRFHAHGIDESLGLDRSTHSLFGASKLAADVLVQEYGRYFGMRTGAFRAGCVTGPAHRGAELHGFLAYLMRCIVEEIPYRVYGHRAKQVRDNIHARDLVRMLWHFFRAPRAGEVYNVGGGRAASCSMLEAIALGEEIAGRALDWTYVDEARAGDHVWWVSDVRRFRAHFPEWDYEFDLRTTLASIHGRLVDER